MAFHVLILCRQVDDFESAKRAGELFGYPLMIKSRRLAYDGRGNSVAKSEEEISSAVNEMRQLQPDDENKQKNAGHTQTIPFRRRDG
ncbi:phosphoribosylaminoimidazole carboxylase, chloroplastic-like isoform X2 [Camellia sinensis]|uniref:phosphoribosylaminoimidazole carboxylase, chloroplastic-like isoform X2 n=1 Tax=Camellia sinensis TaxID=4442 RepID=UPI001036903E|nr:phosphoribosylaminoimidazole carboxylase, chloroplastic-like isoform X2 [Camellia sinensis]